MTISPERARGAIDLEPLDRGDVREEEARSARPRRRIGVRRLVRIVLLVVLVALAAGAVVVSFTGLPEQDDAAVKLITGTVKRGDATTQIGGSGVVEPAVRTELAFGATTAASASAGGGAGGASTTSSTTVSSIAVKVGQRVRRGQVLAALDRSSLDLDVSAAQQSYDAAVAARDEPATTTQDGTTTQDQTDEALDLAVAEAAVTLRAATDARDAATIVAPHGGIVDMVGITAGSAPSASTAAIVLRGTGMRVTIDVAEDDIVDVKVGQVAKIHLVALDEDVEGTVTAIDAEETSTTTSATAGGAGGAASSSLVTFPVDVVLATSPKGLRAGMSADVVVTTASREDVLLVPVTAVVGSGDSAQARIPNGSGGITTTSIGVGLTTSSTAEVTTGMEEGDKVVTGIVRPKNEDDEEETQSAGGLGGIGGGRGMGGPPGGGMGGPPPGMGGGMGGGAPRG